MKLLEIRKYQNRRYYNTTESCHISLEEIHRRICQGHDIRVTDAKSEADITAKVLLQILIEYEPIKLEFFSSELLLQVIRVNDKIQRDFLESYFGDMFSLFSDSRRSMEDFVRQARGLSEKSVNPFTASFEAMNPFAKMFGDQGAQGTPVDRVAEELAALRKEVEDLKKRGT